VKRRESEVPRRVALSLISSDSRRFSHAKEALINSVV
jgi:hypothetical protein